MIKSSSWLFLIICAGILCCCDSSLWTEPTICPSPDLISPCTCRITAWWSVVECTNIGANQLREILAGIRTPVFQLHVNNYTEKQLPDEFLRDKNIGTFSIRFGNKLRRIRRQDFLGVKNLEHLEIVDNPNLSRIHKNAFNNLAHIESIFIKNNPQLTEVDLNLDRLTNLKWLNFRGNKIDRCQLALSPTVDPRQVKLVLEGNPTECECRLRWDDAHSTNPVILHATNSYRRRHIRPFPLTNCNTDETTENN